MNEKYEDLKEKHKELKQRYKEETTALQESVDNYKDQLKTTLKRLKVLYSEHYKPLLEENTVKDELISRFDGIYKAMSEQLQILISIIRLPRMCTEFHKVMRRKSKAIQKFTESRAVAALQTRI